MLITQKPSIKLHQFFSSIYWQRKKHKSTLYTASGKFVHIYNIYRRSENMKLINIIARSV